MPKLSDYLLRESTAALPTAAASAATAARVAPARPPGAAEPAPSALQLAAATAQLNVAVPAAASTLPDAAVAAEIARLQRQHAHRLRDHGPRMYRHPDGHLLPHPPPPQPLTVANRQKWSGLVKYCRVQPGVDQQLDRSGVSARYHVNTTYDQHVDALAAAGMNPETDAAGIWSGAEPAVHDPLSSAATGHDHPLAWAEWRLLTRSVLQRATELHSKETLEKNGWQELWEAVQMK